MEYPYKQRKVSGRKMDEHRFIMEQHLGRRLDGRREQVHHINGDKRDNRLENLQVVSPKEHAALHGMWKHSPTKLCTYCGTEFTPHPTKRARAMTCSPECRYAQVSEKNRNPDAPRSMYRKSQQPS